MLCNSNTYYGNSDPNNQLSADFSLLMSAAFSGAPWKVAEMIQTLGLLPSLWETWMELQPLGLFWPIFSCGWHWNTQPAEWSSYYDLLFVSLSLAYKNLRIILSKTTAAKVIIRTLSMSYETYTNQFASIISK